MSPYRNHPYTNSWQDRVFGNGLPYPYPSVYGRAPLSLMPSPSDEEEESLHMSDEKDTQRLEATILALESTIAELRTANRASNHQLKDRTQQLRSSNEQNRGLRTQLDKYHAEIQSLKSIDLQRSVKLENEIQESSSVSAENNRLRAQLGECQSEMVRLQNRIQGLISVDEENKILRARLESMTTDWSETKIVEINKTTHHLRELVKVEVKGDGFCLYHSLIVALQAKTDTNENDPKSMEDLRNKIIRHLLENMKTYNETWKKTPDEYKRLVKGFNSPGGWNNELGDLPIVAAATFLGRAIHVQDAIHGLYYVYPNIINPGPYKEPLLLNNEGNCHFDAIVHRNHLPVVKPEQIKREPPY